MSFEKTKLTPLSLSFHVSHSVEGSDQSISQSSPNNSLKINYYQCWELLLALTILTIDQQC
jgi:hypothetical protein